MPRQLDRERLPHRWIGSAAIWLTCCFAITALLVWSLHRRANPWRLQMTVPSGLREIDHSGYSGSFDASADLSFDGRLLAVARPSGQLEIWDLPTLQRKTTLGPPMPVQSGASATGNAVDVHWLADGQHIAVSQQPGWRIFGFDGSLITAIDNTMGAYAGAAASPAEPLFACSGTNELFGFDESSGRNSFHIDLGYINGGNRRIEWSTDGRYLLLNDVLGVRVMDGHTGENICWHRELDLSLPPPMIATATSGMKAWEEARSSSARSNTSPHFAVLADSRFAPRADYFATAYRSYEFLPAAPGQNRLRLYESPTGELLWDALLPAKPRQLAFSSDGKTIYVLQSEGVIQVVDAEHRRLLKQLAGRPDGSSPTLITPAPDNRWLATSEDQLWLIDTAERCAPLRLEPASPGTSRILFSHDGMQLIDVGRDTTVRIFRRTRTPSPLGAFALPETWGVYLLMLCGLIGVVVIAGLDAMNRNGEALPWALWTAIVLATAAAGLIGGGDLVAAACDRVYRGVPVLSWSQIAGICIAPVVLFAIALGLARLQRPSWMLQLGVAGFAVVMIATVAVTAWRDLHVANAVASSAMHSLHGWRMSQGVEMAMKSCLALGWALVEIYLLLQPQVRVRFPRKARRAGAGGPRGFPLDNP